MDIYELWNKRISTGALNRWLDGITAHHPPPLTSGRRIKLRYMTQAKTRPPTFVVFASRPDKLPESYSRYLVNALREDFEMPGVPLRLHTKKGENPYAKKK
jgi:GTP-binding protein